MNRVYSSRYFKHSPNPSVQHHSRSCLAKILGLGGKIQVSRLAFKNAKKWDDEVLMLFFEQFGRKIEFSICYTKISKTKMRTLNQGME